MLRSLILLLLSLFLTLTVSAPVYAPGTTIHIPRSSLETSEGHSWTAHLPRLLRRFLTPGQVAIEEKATPATGLDKSALGLCFYIGSDFLMHDCNEQADLKAASINSAKTPEQLAIVAKASASLAAKLAKASAAAAQKAAESS